MVESVSNGFYVQVVTEQMKDVQLQEPYIYYFSYQITIKNLTNYPAKLISRFWKIWESGGKIEHVNGLGVVGLQPIIEPGSSFTYTSGCPLTTSLGQMSGHYNFIQLETNASILVKIPPFQLIAQSVLN
jgi:ApaG protein